MTDLSDLIERVRGVAGADDPTLRYIDCHLWVLGQGGDARMHVCDSSTKDFVWERGMDGLWVRGVVKFRDVPKYTASIHAATALIAAKLPGWLVTMEFGEGKPCAMMLRPGFEDGRHVIIESAATLPLALCLALLVALTQEGQ